MRVSGRLLGALVSATSAATLAYGGCAAPYEAATDDGGSATDAAGTDGGATDAAGESAADGASTDACTTSQDCAADAGALVIGVSPTSNLLADETDVFWADPQKKELSQVSLAGGKPLKLATNLALNADLATDGTYLYFTVQESLSTWSLYRARIGMAASAQKINVAPYTGAPKGLALDATFAYTFQTGVTANYALAALPLSGAALESIVLNDPAEKGLLILGGNLWWTQPSASWVVTVNKTIRGAAGGAVVANSGQPGADLLFTAGSNMYWANLSTTPVQIQWAPGGDSVSRSVTTAPTKPVSLTTDAKTVYWADVDSIWAAPADGSGAASRLATGLAQPGVMALTTTSLVLLERGRGAIVVLAR